MAVQMKTGQSARLYHTHQAHYLFRRFNFNDFTVNTSQAGKAFLGVLPANAVPLETYVRVNTAFTGANLIAGTSAAGSSAAVVTTADVAAGTTGLYVVDRYTGTFSTVDVPLFIQTKATGETVGQADVWLMYLPANPST